MAILEDFFDPNTWINEEYEHRIYADDYANDYAIVDQIDYQYLIQWRWKLKKSKTYPGTKMPKAYLARTGHEGFREDRVCATIYLHQVVMQRKGTPKPVTNKKIIVDHANGNGFNCKRHNLRYATLSFNAKNRFGINERHLFEELV